MQNHFSALPNSPAPPGSTGGSFDWNDLKYFLAVARSGGLSRAALELGSSASTVSRHVSALEQRLGVRLFVRLQTGYLLTDEGSELFERVAEVERSTQAVERRSSASGAQAVSGLVRLAAAESVGMHLVVPKLPLLRERHPALRLELRLSLQRADLARREADLALRAANPATDAAQQDHIAHALGAITYQLYAAPSLLQRAGTDDWRALDYITWAADWAHLSAKRWLTQAYGGRLPAFSSNTLESQFIAACAGLGVALLPPYLAAREPSLQRLTVSDPLPESGVWLVYHRDLKTSPRVQAVRDFLFDVVGAALGGQARP